MTTACALDGSVTWSRHSRQSSAATDGANTNDARTSESSATSRGIGHLRVQIPCSAYTPRADAWFPGARANSLAGGHPVVDEDHPGDRAVQDEDAMLHERVERVQPLDVAWWQVFRIPAPRRLQRGDPSRLSRRKSIAQNECSAYSC